ncbi:polysaccharide lyase [Aliiroseovarius sp. YM-037]|uniref:polysaccharide lyase n=1 Tax=Aliiroseovarius sp. YM-037 TaxID=3341728 RepID=UPI003A80162D
MAVTKGRSAALSDDWRQPLFDGFEGPDFAAEGGLYYKKNFEQSAGTVEFQSAEKRTGKGAVKLSVRPISHPDAAEHSERAELWERPSLRVPYGQPIWYGFSVKFADPIPQNAHRYLIAQWKREIGPEAVGDFSPFLALRMNRGKLFVTVETNYIPEFTAGTDSHPATCAPGQTRIWPRAETNQTRALVAADSSWTPDDGGEFTACTDEIEVINRGNPLPRPDEGWIDFAILTKPGPEGDGHIELFANDKWVVTVKGKIGHSDRGLGENQYAKIGPYRAAGSGIWTMYYDDFRRSPHCEDVLRDVTACAKIK